MLFDAPPEMAARHALYKVADRTYVSGIQYKSIRQSLQHKWFHFANMNSRQEHAAEGPIGRMTNERKQWYYGHTSGIPSSSCRT